MITQPGTMMITRRNAVKLILAFSAGLTLVTGKLGQGLQAASRFARKILLAKDTDLSTLTYKNPAKLDASQLATTPRGQFGVMGQTRYKVNLKAWHLRVSGETESTLKLSYDDILQLPSIERNVLLICYGYFAHNGLWKGISSASLLKMAGLKPGVTHVKFSGPRGIKKKSATYTLEEVMADKVFLAYHLNGDALPESMGFPLRLVAEDHFGKYWIKYADEVQLLT